MWDSGFSPWARCSMGGGEDLGLSASSLDGGFGLIPFTYVVVGSVTVEKEVLVDSGEHTLVSEESGKKWQIEMTFKRSKNKKKKKEESV